MEGDYKPRLRRTIPLKASWRMQSEGAILSGMDEGRKRVLLIAAAILAARKLCQLESTRPSPALHSIIADAVIFAERIMQRIDAEWPTRR
jgi:hypothetical protein